MSKRSRGCVLCILNCFAFWALIIGAARLDAGDLHKPRTGILVMAHGGDEAWNAAVEEAIAPLQKEWPVVIAFGMAERESLQRGKQNDGRVIVVPFRLFGFGEYDKILEGLDYVADRKGLLPHPLITDWIRMQAEECFRRAGWENPFAATLTEDAKAKE
jgi:hypothetical protein